VTEKWIRTCQECGFRVAVPTPPLVKQVSNSYKEKKCPRCKSPGAFDFGSSERVVEKGD